MKSHGCLQIFIKIFYKNVNVIVRRMVNNKSMLMKSKECLKVTSILIEEKAKCNYLQLLKNYN